MTEVVITNWTRYSNDDGIFNWCRENCKYTWAYTGHYNRNDASFEFKNEEDAILFKLRWA